MGYKNKQQPECIVRILALPWLCHVRKIDRQIEIDSQINFIYVSRVQQAQQFQNYSFRSKFSFSFLTLGRGCHPPVRFFWVLSQRIKHQHLMFSLPVSSSLACILRQVQCWSVSMIARYDIISRRWSSHFWVKAHVFSTFFNNKSKPCG